MEYARAWGIGMELVPEVGVQQLRYEHDGKKKEQGMESSELGFQRNYHSVSVAVVQLDPYLPRPGSQRLRTQIEDVLVTVAVVSETVLMGI